MDGGRELEERRERKLQLVCKINERMLFKILKDPVSKENRSFFSFIFLFVLCLLKGKFCLTLICCSLCINRFDSVHTLFFLSYIYLFMHVCFAYIFVCIHGGQTKMTWNLIYRQF